MQNIMNNTYIVLLRGINVGGKNLVPMKELVAVLEKHNYQNIRTYIQSGNIVLQSQRQPDDIASIVQERFGFEPVVYVLEESELDAAVANNPYRSSKGKDIHFYFCNDKPKIDTLKVQRYKSESEKFHIDGKVFYLYAPDGIGRSKLVANLEPSLGVTATGRNLNTIQKLQHMAQNV
jgi:uncharacterized protein (DUF1697 family)